MTPRPHDRVRVFHTPSGVTTMDSPVVKRYPTKIPTFQIQRGQLRRHKKEPEKHPFSKLKAEHVRCLAFQAFGLGLAIVAH